MTDCQNDSSIVVSIGLDKHGLGTMTIRKNQQCVRNGKIAHLHVDTHSCCITLYLEYYKWYDLCFILVSLSVILYLYNNIHNTASLSCYAKDTLYTLKYKFLSL